VVKGGLGSASLDLGEGLMVGALAAVNPVGSVYMPDGKTFWAWPFEIDGEFGGRRPADRPKRSSRCLTTRRLAEQGRLTPGANTTLAVVAVNADLSPGECKRVAMMAQDGLSRAIRPAHTPFDGDVVFADRVRRRRPGVQDQSGSSRSPGSARRPAIAWPGRSRGASILAAD
jgi:L-aminopeptidase/D-esterase-like protein